MPTALIADDDDAPRAQLLAALRVVWPELAVAAECANGVDAWDAFLETGPTVCFLDVRMPGLTGIEVAQRIGGRAHVVFVTACGDHALAAFDAGEVDHVLKPIDTERLAQAVARVQARLSVPETPPPDLQPLVNQLAGRVRKRAPMDVIQAGAGKDARLVQVADVIYFEADSRHTRVVYADAAGHGELRIRTPLKELIAQLDATRFWQIHRSTIVNQHRIARALRSDDGGMALSLRGREETLPVSHHFQGLFHAA